MVSSVSSGDVARMIVDLAKRAGAGMIVAGSRRQGPLARFFTGDVASRLLRDAPCPVLIVPSRPHTGKSSAAASASSDSAHAQTQRT
jgi:nucleotide-binding universal stress UspA family protein